MKALLKFLDYGASDEGHELAWYGIEGTHFTKKRRRVHGSGAGQKKTSSHSRRSGKFSGSTTCTRGHTAAVWIRQLSSATRKSSIHAQKTSTPDYATGLYSETAVLKGPELDKKDSGFENQSHSGQGTDNGLGRFCHQTQDGSGYG